MDLLITATDVKTRMGLLGNTDSDATIESAIEAAQLHIQAVIGTELAFVASTKDRFFLNPDYNSGLRVGGVWRLLLRRGFVRGSTAPVVYTHALWNTPLDEATVVPDTDYELDMETGVLSLDENDDYLKQYISVVYSSGFNADEVLPDWLKEVILAYVPITFTWGPITIMNPEAKSGYQAAADHALVVAGTHNRNRIPFTMRVV